MPSPEKFRRSLAAAGISPETILRIETGYEDVCDKAPKKKRAAFFRNALEVLTDRMDPEILQRLMESNACCKSGAREKASKAFARENAAQSLAEKLEKIASVPYMGHPILNSDGTITLHAVSWMDAGKYRCACSQFNGVKLTEPVSRNYCFCCAGHFKYHYEIMLGVKLRTVEVVSSPLASLGKDPCVIRYALRHEEDDGCLPK